MLGRLCIKIGNDITAYFKLP